MLILKGGTVLTYLNNGKFYCEKTDVLIKDTKIKKIGKNLQKEFKDAIIENVEDKYIIPGFVQSHIHLCQVLFKGSADDMELMDWLEKRIWPLEAMHTAESISISAKMGIAELMSGGTTTVVDMGTIRHTEYIAEELVNSGIRAFFGKTMMDRKGLPDFLKEDTQKSIEDSLDLYNKYHGKGDGRIKYAFAPRFAVSCTDELLKQVSDICKDKGLLFHTHASENKKEIELVKELTGMKNIEYFEKKEIAGENLLLAHCVWVDDEEREILKKYNIKVIHCPSANMKLASGIAPIPKYLKDKITVGLGADGAPCNNNLSMFKEMKLAALIQKPFHGPTCMNAGEAFKMATLGGAKVVGMENEIGSIEEGKKADIVILDLEKINSSPYFDPVSSIVYSAAFSNVDKVFIDGKVVYNNGKHLTINTEHLVKDANVILRDFMVKL
ncbi:MAG: 5'-deoxyadenosine deaminase [Candidatus Muirbacterium halophilum]|nr:5'-deoxyadenosine deaminase [Candidatus Muirbacterium halophilum]MCK9475668.1 5'-deoxyadenosine deaminase [Candidatus Muirbacterium halophilum]